MHNIWFIHGTWGRAKSGDETNPAKLAWYQAGSKFRNRFTAESDSLSISSNLRIFEWSGKNSVHERDLAAKELAEKIRYESSGDGCNILIAHSHGGNVAVGAMNYLKERDKRTVIITLATPFLRIEPTRPTSTSKFALLLICLAAIASIFRTIDAIVQVLTLHTFEEIVGSFLFSILILIPLGIAAITAGFLSFHSFDKTKEKEEETKLVPGALANVEFLILRAPNDEADLAMAAGTLGNIFCNKMIAGLILIFRAWAGIMLFLATFYIIGDAYRYFTHNSFIAELSFNLFKTINDKSRLIYVVDFIFLLFVMGSAFKLVYGFDLFIPSYTSLIVQSSTLDTEKSACIRTLKNKDSKILNHYIYENEQCPEEIVKYIKEL